MGPTTEPEAALAVVNAKGFETAMEICSQKLRPTTRPEYVKHHNIPGDTATFVTIPTELISMILKHIKLTCPYTKC